MNVEQLMTPKWLIEAETADEAEATVEAEVVDETEATDKS